MNSPINGNRMTHVSSMDTVIFRRKKIEYLHKAYLCEESGLTFTTTEQDTANMERILDEYENIIARSNDDAMKSFWVVTVIVIAMILMIIL